MTLGYIMDVLSLLVDFYRRERVSTTPRWQQLTRIAHYSYLIDRAWPY